MSPTHTRVSDLSHCPNSWEQVPHNAVCRYLDPSIPLNNMPQDSMHMIRLWNCTRSGSSDTLTHIWCHWCQNIQDYSGIDSEIGTTNSQDNPFIHWIPNWSLCICLIRRLCNQRRKEERTNLPQTLDCLCCHLKSNELAEYKAAQIHTSNRCAYHLVLRFV